VWCCSCRVFVKVLFLSACRLSVCRVCVCVTLFLYPLCVEPRASLLLGVSVQRIMGVRGARSSIVVYNPLSRIITTHARAKREATYSSTASSQGAQANPLRHEMTCRLWGGWVLLYPLLRVSSPITNNRKGRRATATNNPTSRSVTQAQGGCAKRVATLSPGAPSNRPKGNKGFQRFEFLRNVCAGWGNHH